MATGNTDTRSSRSLPTVAGQGQSLADRSHPSDRRLLTRPVSCMTGVVVAGIGGWGVWKGGKAAWLWVERFRVRLRAHDRHMTSPLASTHVC